MAATRVWLGEWIRGSEGRNGGKEEGERERGLRLGLGRKKELRDGMRREEKWRERGRVKR